MSRRMAVMCRAGLAASHSRKNVGRGPGRSQSTVRQRQSARCCRQAQGTDLTGTGMRAVKWQDSYSSPSTDSSPSTAGPAARALKEAWTRSDPNRPLDPRTDGM